MHKERCLPIAHILSFEASARGRHVQGGARNVVAGRNTRAHIVLYIMVLDSSGQARYTYVCMSIYVCTSIYVCICMYISVCRIIIFYCSHVYITREHVLSPLFISTEQLLLFGKLLCVSAFIPLSLSCRL